MLEQLRADFAQLPGLLAEHVAEEPPEPAPEPELVGAASSAEPDQMGLF
jgi:hypothetical protein